MNSNPIKILVCRVGRLPVVEYLSSDDDDSFLTAMQKVVGGNVEVIGLDDGAELWMNEDGIGLGLPLNRRIPTVGRAVPSWLGGEDAFVINTTGADLPRPGEPAEWRILGDFFIAGATRHGDLADVPDEAVERYTRMFDSEDIAAAKQMNDLRTTMENRP